MSCLLNARSSSTSRRPRDAWWVWQPKQAPCHSLSSVGTATRHAGPSLHAARPLQALDYETIRVLELLANARTGSARDSLFGVVNRTQTAVGTRLLRAQLVSPVNDLFTLNTRFDAVEDLLAHAPVRTRKRGWPCRSREAVTAAGMPTRAHYPCCLQAYSGLRTLLCKALDLDALLSQFTATPKTMTPRTARAAIHAIIALKHCLKLVRQRIQACCLLA